MSRSLPRAVLGVLRSAVQKSQSRALVSPGAAVRLRPVLERGFICSPALALQKQSQLPTPWVAALVSSTYEFLKPLSGRER